MIVFSLNLRTTKSVRCKQYKFKRYINKLKYCYNDNTCYEGVYGDGLAGTEERYGVCTLYSEPLHTKLPRKLNNTV